MKPKILIAAGLVLAFVLGTMADGIYSASTRAFSPAEENVIAPARSVRATPAAVRIRYVEPRVVSAVDRAPAPTFRAPRKRSLEREMLIVGGSAGAGAAIGAVAGGKKGAGVGALSGGIAGLVYDLATRNK